MDEKSDPPLVTAAAAFEAELVTYSRLGELFLRTRLDSLKHLQRAQETLGEISASESRLQQCGQALIAALGEARKRQEDLSAAVIAHAPNVKSRGETLGQLMTTMGELAKDANQVKDSAPEDTAQVSARVIELSKRAEALSKQCYEAEFAELGEQVHALHQRLKAVGEKLQKATPN